jgi:hypothetical protein
MLCLFPRHTYGTHWPVRSMDDVSIGPLIGADFHCCEAVFQTNVVPLFPPYKLASEVHGRCIHRTVCQCEAAFNKCCASFFPHWLVRSMDDLWMIYYYRLQNQSPYASRQPGHFLFISHSFVSFCALKARGITFI